MRKILLLLLCFVTVLASCRKDEEIIKSTDKEVTEGTGTPEEPKIETIKGFFLLNEGNMGSNKCTLDYFDYETGIYTKNIYAERNPGVVKELGDVGNDIQIYGEKLYAVINASNFVEVMDVNSVKHIAQISIANCRYIVFNDKYAYVSSYAGPIQIGNSQIGFVAKIDTATFEIVGKCTVGYQPEEMVITNNKLYVANSGGYNPSTYDKTVSVIDLTEFKEIKKIDVEKNLHRLELDNQGKIWVSSRGDYFNLASNTFIIDPKTDLVTDKLDIPNTNMTIAGDSLYIYSSEFSKETYQTIVKYSIVNTKTKKVVDDRYIKDGTDKMIEMPYGTAINQQTKEIFVTDAGNYVSPGTLYCFTGDGKLKWKTMTGDIPAHIAFTTRKLQPLKK